MKTYAVVATYLLSIAVGVIVDLAGCIEPAVFWTIGNIGGMLTVVAGIFAAE